MALIVEDGSARPDAEAFASVAFADGYFQSLGTPDAWANATEQDKEKALRHGAIYMESVYGNRWGGYRVIDTQSLSFPRDGMYDRNEFLVDSDIVPDPVKRANAELALRHLQGTELLPDRDQTGSVNMERIVVDVIEIETRNSAPTIEKPVFDSITMMIDRYFKTSRGMTRIRRA